MSDREKDLARLWRDYEAERVGFQLEGQPEKLVTPARAHEIADELEDAREQWPSEDVAEMRRFIRDLRAYADEVREVSERAG